MPESLETLLNSLEGIGLGEDEGDGEFTSFLETMMGQLTSKEMLYDPLKELATNVRLQKCSSFMSFHLTLSSSSPDILPNLLSPSIRGTGSAMNNNTLVSNK